MTVLYWERLVVLGEGSEGRGNQGGTAVNQRDDDKGRGYLEYVIILMLCIVVVVRSSLSYNHFLGPIPLQLQLPLVSRRACPSGSPSSLLVDCLLPVPFNHSAVDMRCYAVPCLLFGARVECGPRRRLP